MEISEQNQRFTAWRDTCRRDLMTGFQTWQEALQSNGVALPFSESRAAFEEFRVAVCLKDDDWTVFDAWCAAVTYAEVINRAAEVFGDRKAALKWMSQPAMALDQARPFAVIWRDSHLVVEVLVRMEHGVY